MSFTEFLAAFETRRNRKAYEQANKQALQSSVIMELLFSQIDTNVTQHVKHPLQDVRVLKYIQEVQKLPSGQEITVNFGDSLTDLSRKWLGDSMDAIFSISGSWHYHIADVAEIMRPHLIIKNVKYVTCGCFGGNPMLVYQNYQNTLQESLTALSRIRAVYPGIKMIVYGLPPVYNINATKHTMDFDAALIEWCRADGNAVFVELKSMGGILPWLPKVAHSSDGVHLTPRGARRMSKAVNAAKSALPGSIILA